MCVCAHPHLVHNMTDIVMLFPLISRICIVLRQLRLAVAEAIGYTVHLLSTTQLDGQLAKLMPAIAQLYRKHQDHYYISQVCTYVRTYVCSIQLDDMLLPAVFVHGGGCCM